MISPIGAGLNNQNPSFRGIVKVEHVLVNGVKTTDFNVIDKAVKQLKAVLMRQADTKDTFVIKNAFRKEYSVFDKDYTPPSYRITGDTRAIMTKVRPKGSQQTFIATGKDAENVAYSGIDIGRKRELERISEGKKFGVEEIARDDYREAKDEILTRYYYDSKRRSNLPSNLHPKVFIYTETDKKGNMRLRAARLENDLGSTQRFELNPKPAPKVERKISEPQKAEVVEKTEPKPVKSEEKNPILEELSTKSWDAALVKPKRTHKKRRIENPNQTDFFGELFSDMFK